MTKAKQNLVKRILKEINKTDKQIMEESLVEIIEEYTIECKSQIAYIKSGKIPQAKLRESRAAQSVKKAKEAREKVQEFGIVSSNTFADYVDSIALADKLLKDAEDRLATATSEIVSLELTLAKFESILETLES